MSNEIEQRTSDECNFAIGEVAIFWSPGSPNHGCDVTILSGLRRLQLRSTYTGIVGFGLAYQIEAPSDAVYGPFNYPGAKKWVAPTNLRKKRPPRKDLQVIRWDQCPWQPEKINV